MLDDSLKTQLQAYLERLRRPVEIVAALDDGEASSEMRALLQDIVPLHPMLSLVEHRDPGARVPSFSLGQPGEAGLAGGIAGAAGGKIHRDIQHRQFMAFDKEHPRTLRRLPVLDGERGLCRQRQAQQQGDKAGLD